MASRDHHVLPLLSKLALGPMLYQSKPPHTRSTSHLLPWPLLLCPICESSVANRSKSKMIFCVLFLTLRSSVSSGIAWDNNTLSVSPTSVLSSQSDLSPALPSATSSLPPQVDPSPMCPTGGKIGNLTLDVRALLFFSLFTSNLFCSLMISKLDLFSTLLVISGSLRAFLSLLHRLKHLNPTFLHLVVSLSNSFHLLCHLWVVLMQEILRRLVLVQTLPINASDLTSKVRVLAARQMVPKNGVNSKFPHIDTTRFWEEKSQYPGLRQSVFQHAPASPVGTVY
jgi:hypothetical protein